MTIHTFFSADPPPDGQGQIIRHFHNSWRKRGWEVTMMNPRTYASHPKRLEYIARIDALLKESVLTCGPSDKHRLLRYLALDSLGSQAVWLAEYDVINFDFEAHDRYDPRYRGGSVLCGQGIMQIGEGIARSIVESILDGVNPSFSISALHGSQDYLAYNWEKSPLVHFSRMACGDESKSAVIESCGRFY
ncbi:MAG: hypothetical protein E4G90_02390 [Gemmatimonadales bacterium]|nr:MAG: hypothetical protein E4G90_02390 [Gemmatimonadales bacterium]